MLLLIDNYDSFTMNLYQYLSAERTDVIIVRNNELSLEEIRYLDPKAIILSSGPGFPGNTGVCIPVVKKFYKDIPVLGICLGHQIIAKAFGGRLKPAEEIKHGKTTFIAHNHDAIFFGMPSVFEAMCYHSFVIDREQLPEELRVIAVSEGNDEIMAVKHREYPVYGIQFHPESIGTENGKQIIRNFVRQHVQQREGKVIM